MMDKYDNISVLNNTLQYLRFYLVWPKKGTESNPGAMFYIKFMLLTISTTFIPYGSLAHMTAALYEKNGVSIDVDLAVIISIVGTYYFNFSYVSNVKEISSVFRDFMDFETFEMPPGYEKFNKKWNKLSNMHFIYYVFLGSILIIFTPIVETNNCIENNIEKGTHEVCGLLMNVWLPFHFDFFPLKQFILVFQIYSAFFSYALSSTISFSIMESMEHIVFRLDYVKTLFVKALRQEKYELRKEIFRHSVQYHNFLIHLTQRLNKCYSACIFVHVLLTGAILGCVGYQLLQGPHLLTIVLFIGWFLSLIMVASEGQRLIVKATSIGDAIYSTNWYNVEIEIQKNIIMVLMRCQKPIYLLAGPFGFMSYQMIVTILKTSYSILSVMKANTY